jgi:hypothetical protein
MSSTLTAIFLSGWPVANTAFQSTKVPSFYPTGLTTSGSNSPVPTNAAPYSYTLSTTFPTNGQYVYTPGSTLYIAAILDKEGVVPARIFGANNGTGSYVSSTAQALPTLDYIIQLQTTAWDGTTEYGGYKVVITPNSLTGSAGNPSGAVLTETGQTAPVTQYPSEPVLVQVPGYTTASPSGNMPQPEMVFQVSMSACIITSTTAY